jgi:peptidoglycan DL-endopeptidase CwlO
MWQTAMKIQTPKKIILFLAGLVVLFGAVGIPLFYSSPHPVLAATIDELKAQANALQAQIDANNSQSLALAGQADSLKNKIAEFDIQIASINSQIELTNVKLQQLEQELAKAQAELDREKELLKASLQALYKKGGASTVELLVGSDSFSQFINDQTYLDRLKSGIQSSASKVVSLKNKIQSEQEEQKQLLLSQTASKDGLEKSKAERQQLLDQTQGEEARYQSIASDLREQQKKLLTEIVARSRVISGVGSGGYPAIWANAAKDSMVDSWGMFNRECVSFAAWRVANSGRYMPSNFPILAGGNATDWPESAQMDGISIGTEPRIGAVAIWRGYYGHAAFVEDVMGGEIRVSEYNAVPAYGGLYSERIVNAGDPDVYIYF